MTKFIIIDGSACLYRSFYALPEFKNSQGQPTQAVYGMVTMVQKLIREERPDYLCICYDLPDPTFRHKEFSEYKSQRKPTPEDLIAQIPDTKEVLDGMGIAQLEKSGFEADDLMAALAVMGKSSGMETVVVTGDKDILQLVEPGVTVLRITSNAKEYYDVAKVIEKYGIEPKRIPDYLGLTGDTVDNIPGVPGIGDKTARSLLAEFGSIDNILSRVEEVKSTKVKDLLKKYPDQARQSRDLATLRSEVNLVLEPSQFVMKDSNIPKLRELYRKLEFNGMLESLGKEDVISSEEQQEAIEFYTIETSTQWTDFQNQLHDFQAVSFFADEDNELLVMGHENKAWFVPIKSEFISKGFDGPSLRYYAYDWKSLIKRLNQETIHIPDNLFDIQIAGYLINAQWSHQSLEKMVFDCMQVSLPPLSSSSDELDFAKEPDYPVLAQRAAMIYRLGERFQKELKIQGLDDLFKNIEMPLVRVLAEMEERGIKIDTDYLKELSREITGAINKISGEIYQIAGHEFNLNSPKQLAQVLFEELKLTSVKKTKTGYSTDVEVLEILSEKHPLPAKILEYRTLAKIQSTYVDAFLQICRPESKTIHSHFQQAVANTGRIISSEPNLQNLPAFSEWGDKIRRSFIVRSAGNYFVSGDYSQIELRLLAHISGDEDMRQAFRDNKDIHTETAVKIFKVKSEDVTPEMRRAAKAVNFGIAYGISAYGLSKSINTGVVEAQEYIQAYFTKFLRVKEYMDKTVAEARAKGYVTTLAGRHCPIPEILSSRNNMREAAERQAINAPIQGSAADMLKIAMIHTDRMLKQNDYQSELLLTIHDELVLECPPNEVNKITDDLKVTMEEAMILDVPIVVDIKTGRNLAEC